MVKAYLRYEQVRTFGVIASPEASPVYADDAGKLLVTAALERLSVWDIRRGLEVRSLDPPPRESGATPAITRIARAPGSSLVASGAADGSVRRLVVRPAEYRRLVAYIQASLVDGGERRHGYYAYDAFYAARGHYSALRTCNGWVGDALRFAGVRVGAWTPLPLTVMWWFPRHE